MNSDACTFGWDCRCDDCLEMPQRCVDCNTKLPMRYNRRWKVKCTRCGTIWGFKQIFDQNVARLAKQRHNERAAMRTLNTSISGVRI